MGDLLWFGFGSVGGGLLYFVVVWVCVVWGLLWLTAVCVFWVYFRVLWFGVVLRILGMGMMIIVRCSESVFGWFGCGGVGCSGCIVWICC